MTSDVQERGGPSATTHDNWLGGTETGGDVPGRVLGSIQAGHPFTIVTGMQGVAGDLAMATVDRLHAAHIETTTIDAPLPNLAALTRAISTALSVVVDTERPLVVIVRQAEALRPEAVVRLPALAGLQRSGRQVLCFLLMGRPTLWPALATIGLAGLEQNDAAHIRLATPGLFESRTSPTPARPEPPPPRKPFVEVREAEPPARKVHGRRRDRVVLPAGIAVAGLALVVGLLATHRTPPAGPRQPAIALRPMPDLTRSTPAPPMAAAPMAPALPDLPQPAPPPAQMPLPAPPAAVPAPAAAAPMVVPVPVVPSPPEVAPVPAIPPASAAPGLPANPPVGPDTPSPAVVPAPAVAPPAPPAPAAAAARLVLPDAGMLHIILRFRQDSEPARERALHVAASLRAAGATVDGPVAVAEAATGSTIGYFFNADRSAADRLAHRLPAHFVHIRTPFGSAAGPMMRPGELIVTIGADPTTN